MLYIGIGPNRGRVLETDEEALDYAVTSLGLAPYLSGNWVAYRDWGTYYAENPEEAEGFEEPGEADGWIV